MVGPAAAAASAAPRHGRAREAVSAVLTEFFTCRAGAPANAVDGSSPRVRGIHAVRRLLARVRREAAAGRGPEKETRMKITTSPFAAACGALALALAWAVAGQAFAGERPLGGVVTSSRYTGECGQGQQKAGQRFCISKEKQGQRQYHEAVAACEGGGARVCTGTDLIDLHIETELGADYDPEGVWLGDLRTDGAVSCGVAGMDADSTEDEFVGACDERDNRSFWCCADL